MAALIEPRPATATHVPIDGKRHGVRQRAAGQYQQIQLPRTTGETCMTDRRSPAWRLALGLTAHAARILPAERRQWSQAMIAEVDNLPSAGAALRWAIGCVFAGYIERMRTMTHPIGHVARWVLSLEMLICFVPVTFLFVAVILSAMRGVWSIQTSLLYASATIVGPIGLVISVRSLVLKKAVGRTTSIALCLLAAWTFVSYLALVLSNQSTRPSDWWQIFVLIAFLPALAVAHLAFIAAEVRKSRAVPEPKR
jgi:hypothetical protein